MKNSKKTNVIVWNKTELKIEGRRKKTQEALILASGKFKVVVYRTLKDNLESGEKAFTVKLFNTNKQADVRRVTRNTLALAKRAAARWLYKREGVRVSA
jgi:hypothetical protein